MTLTLLTLNYWRYYDLDTRLPKIIEAITTHQPDVILLQETQIDPAHSPLAQVETLKQSLPGYNYSLHSTIYPKTHQRGQALDVPVQHGMSVLSKHPITNSFEYYLRLAGDETEPRSNLCFDIEKNDEIIKLANIHLGNKESWAKPQLQEFVNYLESRHEQRIMGGDFNAYHLGEYQGLYPGYSLSYHHTPYTSYPPDDATLDYFLIPKSYTYQQVQLLPGNLSDHRGLLVTITTD